MGGRWRISNREMKRRQRARLHAQGLGPRDPARKQVDQQEDSSYDESSSTNRKGDPT